MKTSCKFYIFLSITFYCTLGCSALKQSKTHTLKIVPTPPDYKLSKSWAVLPGKYPASLKKFKQIENKNKADVFYVYPTLYSDKKLKDWNADIWNPLIRQDVFQIAIKYQASAWLNAGDLYVPFYRQTHYRIFTETPSEAGKQAWELAYQDVKNAFQYYLKHYNSGKPIIIASHSQGSMHAKRLIKEFFDQKPLQNQLVAAYLIGTRVLPDEFESIKPLQKPDATGGFVSWNAYKMNKLPKKYDDWFRGGVTTNPISWNLQSISTTVNHKGVLSKDLEIYPQSLQVKVIDGLLWTSLPNIPGRFFMSLISDYHFADINLFWKDIEQNAIARVAAWYQKNRK